jgi:hypothetical protein
MSTKTLILKIKYPSDKEEDIFEQTNRYGGYIESTDGCTIEISDLEGILPKPLRPKKP